MDNFSKNRVNFYLVNESDDNQRLDNLLIKILKGVPKSFIYRIIRNGEVRLNKKRSTAFTKVHSGDTVRIPPLKTENNSDNSSSNNQGSIAQHIAANFNPDSFPLLFEDDYFLIINKPSKIACHGGSGISFGIIEQLRHIYPQYKFLELAHRLDKETSGVLILAKKRSALVALQELIKNQKTEKCYLALAIGNFNPTTLNIKLPLTKYTTEDGERRVRIDHQAGKFAHTQFKIINHFTEFTLVKAILKTGRTHQIRVHLQHTGHPIAGDQKYGDFSLNKQLTRLGLKRMFLHAYSFSFVHPITQEKISITAELPQELDLFLHQLDPKYQLHIPH